MNTKLSDRLPASAYRAELIGISGKIENCVSLMVESEESAIAKAKSLAVLCTINLWDRNRLIIRLPKNMLG